eukprot:NODE_6153_length_527_cov_218.884937_g5392_i0.p1 GENE.NODE_6153_length_527_cov_218.884937_g5392_i0~~NODE_6153_length_527_cov_218.884937_g5392_i0.p1  ORF type:complete len:107 (+),score=23.71 NODE_6153_length_527_cov_218.884937_g5392_i0:46-366(+)
MIWPTCLKVCLVLQAISDGLLACYSAMDVLGLLMYGNDISNASMGSNDAVLYALGIGSIVLCCLYIVRLVMYIKLLRADWNEELNQTLKKQTIILAAAIFLVVLIF